MAELWSFICGKRGASRVRVYERWPGSPLQIEWYLHGKRYQRSLKYETGATIYDKDDAVAIAKRTSDRLEQEHVQRYRQAEYRPTQARNLTQLLARWHNDKADEWSEGHQRDQDRYSKLWIRRLGKTAPLTSITPAMVEAVARKEAKDRKWRPRSQQAFLRYIVDAFAYAERKLKWIEAKNNLAGVTIPAAKSKGKAYGLDDVRKLLPKLEEVDDVAGWLGHVLWQTGRRLTAARTLPKRAVQVDDGFSVIEWPEETDKPGNGGLSVVVGRAHELTKKLMKRPGKYVAGKEPPSLDVCDKEWMPAAEKKAGIKHVTGRSWHGLKRRFSDRTQGLKSRAAQAGTREDTLARIYDPKDDLDAMREVAKKLAQEVSAT